jgi:hypothetical protein
MAAASRFLAETLISEHKRCFRAALAEKESAFVPWPSCHRAGGI